MPLWEKTMIAGIFVKERISAILFLREGNPYDIDEVSIEDTCHLFHVSGSCHEDF